MDSANYSTVIEIVKATKHDRVKIPMKLLTRNVQDMLHNEGYGMVLVHGGFDLDGEVIKNSDQHWRNSSRNYASVDVTVERSIWTKLSNGDYIVSRMDESGAIQQDFYQMCHNPDPAVFKIQEARPEKIWLGHQYR